MSKKKRKKQNSKKVRDKPKEKELPLIDVIE